MAKRSGLRQQLSRIGASGQSLEAQIQQLIAARKYSTALQKLRQGLARDPDQVLTVSEADLLLLQGKDDFEQQKYSRAQKALQEALALAPSDDTYYWLAKSLLAQHQLPKALALFQSAFDDKKLPKEMGGCYLKLLFLSDQASAVEGLIKAQPKRFYMPHIHWAKGVIALKADQFTEALAHFKKMGRPASPGDRPTLWQTYTHQRADNWDSAKYDLLSPLGFQGSPFRVLPPMHPAKQRLTVMQLAHSGLSPTDFLDIDQLDLPNRNAVWVLELLSLIAVQNYHDAAHVWLDLPASAKIEYPGLNALQRSLMLLAGEQAGREGEISCTVDFWEEAMVKRDFDPHLALNLQRALMATGAYNKAVRLLTQLMSWLKQAAKQDPQTWPPARLNAALAQLYCFSADCQASLGRYAEVERSLKQAEQLAPGYPDTIGRRGLQAWLKHQKEEAISLLTQALEAGCRFPEVYRTLLEALEADTAATKPIRRKFGQYFGDLGVDSEVEIAPWIEALTYQNYGLLAETASRQQQPSPAMQALKIFVEAASSEPSSSQKVTFDHSQAIPQWEALLAASSPAEQVEVIKAIYLTVQQHAKRNQKGVAALQSNYLSKMAALSSQQLPGADVAHLMIMAMRASDKQLTAAVEAILRRATQPGNTLATAQLELRRFGPSGSLRSLIEAQLKKETQNPQLLLAQATLYPRNSRDYKALYDKGFELARRLQDAAALQAFREEDWFAAQDLTRQTLGPQIGNLDDLDMGDILGMAQQIFGREVPPEILAQLIPELLAEMEDSDEFEEDEDPFFLPLPFSGRRKKSAKKKSRFPF